jgi:hypothetical protein
MNVASSVLWRMAIILKANKVNLFVSSVLFVFWYHSPNFLDTPRIYWQTHNSVSTYNTTGYMLHTRITLFVSFQYVEIRYDYNTGDSRCWVVTSLGNFVSTGLG